MFHIEYATKLDVPFWKTLDTLLPESELLLKISEKRCYILKDDNKSIGIVRYNLFWDLIPFLNMIYFEETYRNKGYGTKAMLHWENEMRAMGHKLVMTSTMVEETSQQFYRKLNYKDCGCLIKDFPPFVETMEMFLMKQL